MCVRCDGLQWIGGCLIMVQFIYCGGGALTDSLQVACDAHLESWSLELKKKMHSRCFCDTLVHTQPASNFL